MINKILIGILMIGTLLVSGCTVGQAIAGGVTMEEFATCLAEEGAVMFGAEWCGHCQSQKKLFGEAFENVEYVECTEDQARCSSAGIRGFPTWKFKDGSSEPGTQTFATLAKKTGCQMP